MSGASGHSIKYDATVPALGLGKATLTSMVVGWERLSKELRIGTVEKLRELYADPKVGGLVGGSSRSGRISLVINRISDCKADTPSATVLESLF